jgi:hypothetical protein
MVGIHGAYVHVFLVYQGAYTIKNYFFKRNLKKRDWKMYA